MLLGHFILDGKKGRFRGQIRCKKGNVKWATGFCVKIMVSARFQFAETGFDYSADIGVDIGIAICFCVVGDEGWPYFLIGAPQMRLSCKRHNRLRDQNCTGSRQGPQNLSGRMTLIFKQECD